MKSRPKDPSKANGRPGLAKALFTLSLVFLGFGLVSLGWAVWPAPEDAAQFTIPAGVLPGAPAGKTYASVADYTLTLNWPTWLRLGGSGTLRATLTENNADGTQAGDRPAQVVLVEPAIAGLPLEPQGRVQAAVAAGQGLALSWELTGAQEGDHAGKVAVTFGFYDESAGELVTVPVAVVDVATRVTALWGLEANLVLWVGFVGLALWGALFVLGRAVEGK